MVAVQEQPPAPPHRLKCLGGWARGALLLVLLLAVTGSFAGAVHRARHRPRDLAFVLVAYHLLVLLLCCVVKLEQLRRDPPAAARVAERRRVRAAAWAVSAALGSTFASRVADAMPALSLKLAVWGLNAVVLGFGFYFLFCCKDAECCNGDHGHGQADAAPPQERALSSEEKV